jgi:ISXO2-like transposase domain/Transposase zinc-ribbon domain
MDRSSIRRPIMPMNWVQFQKGLSLGEFIQRYGTEEGCERELQALRWPEGFECPACQGREYSSFRRGRLLYFQCCACRHQSSLISGTVMAASKLALRVWFQAAYLLSHAKNNFSALELKRHLGVSYEAAWMLKHKLMEAMLERERPRTLGGTVQLDEAFLGGQARGPGSLGRKGKVAFLAAVSVTDSGKPELVCLSRQPATGEDVVVFALNTFEPGTTVVSDGAPSFNYVKWQQLAEHHPIVTGGGQQSCEIPQLKAINIVIGNLKTAITGTYHAFKFKKYADRYLAEYQYRFNRRFDLRSLASRIIRAAAHCKPTPERSLRMAEHCR